MEVVKIRLQAQHHSMADPLDIPKYRNAAHALYTVVREEGLAALYRGVSLTALRQGSNQAVNFTAYSEFRAALQGWQGKTDLPGWQTATIGLVSGAMGPLSNAPIDTIKTRLQKTPAEEGETALGRIMKIGRYVDAFVSLPPPSKRKTRRLGSDIAIFSSFFLPQSLLLFNPPLLLPPTTTTTPKS